MKISSSLTLTFLSFFFVFEMSTFVYESRHVSEKYKCKYHIENKTYAFILLKCVIRLFSSVLYCSPETIEFQKENY